MAHLPPLMEEVRLRWKVGSLRPSFRCAAKRDERDSPLTSALLMERFQLIRQMLHLRGGKWLRYKQRRSLGGGFWAHTRANFQTENVNSPSGRLQKGPWKVTVQLSSSLMKLLLIKLAFRDYYVFHYGSLLLETNSFSFSQDVTGQ